jgi:hypothetical protein
MRVSLSLKIRRCRHRQIQEYDVATAPRARAASHRASAN